MQKKIRLGIIGAGRIVARVMTDLHNAQEIELTAIAGMTSQEAESAAQRYGIKLAFSSFEAMAECDAIDLAYIAIPNPFHAKFACMMMEHGKHVLCEKPLAMNDQEAHRMIACAQENHVFLMEAMWTRFLPSMRDLAALIQEGSIGEIHHIFGEFSYSLSSYDPLDRLFNPALAGGALLDIGVYPLMTCTHLLGWQPEKVQGLCVKTPQGVDMRACLQMLYLNGATAQIFCGMDARSDDVLRIYGTKGYIVMPGSWHPTSFTVYVKGEPEKTYSYQPENEGHHYEFDHVAQCIRDGMTESPIIPWAESLAVAEICTQIRHENGILYPGE